MEYRRMTYRQLQKKLAKLSDAQLDCDVTVVNLQIEEGYAGSFQILDEDGDDYGLDEEHPIITYHPGEEPLDRI